jgi:hypothetical protein
MSDDGAVEAVSLQHRAIAARSRTADGLILRKAVGRERASATRALQTNLTCFASASTPGDLTPSQRQGRSMAWGTPTDARIAALIGARLDVERTGVSVVAGVIDDDGRPEVAP